MIVKLDFPAPELFPNRKNGRHFGSTASAKASARDGAWALTRQQMGAWVPPTGNIALSIVFVPPSGHRRDLDNCLAAAKPALDGVALALGVDDSRFRPVLIDIAQPGKPGAMLVAVGVEIRSGVNLGVA